MFSKAAFAFAFLLSMLAGPALSATSGERKWGPGGKKLISSGSAKNGKYYLKNVGTGEYLTYVREGGQQFFPSKKKSLVLLKGKGKNYSVVKPYESNAKCASSQWDFDLGANWAVALYGCVVGGFKRDLSIKWDTMKRSIFGDQDEDEEDTLYFETADDDEDQENDVLEERDSDGAESAKSKSKRAPCNATKCGTPVRPAKQYFIFKKAKTRHAWNIIASDHVLDMEPRAVTGNCIKRATQNGTSKYVCLNPFRPNNKKQQWYILRKDGSRLGRRDSIVERLTDGSYGRWR